MKGVAHIMGMPLEIELVGGTQEDIDAVFAYFTDVDERFSTYKKNSEISRINRGEIMPGEWSPQMREVMALSASTEKETGGYFSIKRPSGELDPSGIVKGWAIRGASQLIEARGCTRYFLNVGGDIQSRGLDESDSPWTVGIRDPFHTSQIVKVIRPEGRGVATSGTYLRGDHIYNPHRPDEKVADIVSLTVVGPDVYEADRFATAAFAMGRRGIAFIEALPGFEGYLIDAGGIATMTSSFETLVT